MTREEVIELMPLYAVGALDADEARVMEDFLRDASSGDLQELAEWREVVSVLPLALPTATPSPLVKELLMARIAEEAESHPAAPQAPHTEAPAKVLPFTAPRKIERSPINWLAIAAAILMAVTSVYFYLQKSQIAADRDQQVARLKQENKEKDALLQGLDPATRVVAMKGDESPGTNAKVIWDTKEQVWNIVIYDLPAPPSDKDYQLWYVTKNQKISAAVFRPDSQGRTILTLKLPPAALKGLAATAITVEPKGGSEQPTGNIAFQAAI